MTDKAFAKVNLFLDVVGKRADGFHDIVSVMHTVSLYDELSITVSPSTVTNINFSANVSSLDNRENLVYRAIELYLSKAKINATVDVQLTKNIPIASGLGGGSSDAATALRLLNSRFSLFGEEEMLSLCAELGSDVPFLYVRGTALCEGRGEKLRPVKYNGKLDFVIAIGEKRISTPAAYKNLDAAFSDFDGTVSRLGFSEYPKLDLSLNGDSWELPVYNIFETVVDEDFCGVFDLKNRLFDLGARLSLMSGSGPAVFGIFDDAEVAQKAAKELEKEGILAFCAHSTE